MSPRPLIGLPACRKYIEPHQFHAAGEKYLAAITVAAEGLPVVIPALGSAGAGPELLERLDGLFLTGSPSNVEPHHYDGRVIDPQIAHDPHRDATILPLIRTAVRIGLPLLGVCRGFQEMNVAFGGTLHQKVHEVDSLDDHREDSTAPLPVRYQPTHPVFLTMNGELAKLAGGERLEVNSLHKQGVDRLGESLEIEACAADGLVEAFHVRGARNFALAVQWHPEWHVLQNSFSAALFEAFGDACRARATSRQFYEHDTEMV